MGLARHASRLPLTAISWSLAAWERSAGLREFALRRGNEALQIAAHTPLGRLLPTLDLDDGADEEAARIAAAVRTEPATPPAKASRTTPTRAPQQTQQTTTAAKPAPKPEPEPKAAPTPEPEPAASALTPSAVSTEVEQIVEQVVDQLAIPEPETRDELPIPDFDNITLGSLRARLRNLSVEQLVALREWEQAHAHRMPVLTALDNRIAKLGPADAYPDGGKPSTPTRSG